MGSKKDENINNFRNLPLQEKRLISGIKLLDKEKRLRILKALDLAKKSHEGQKRREGDPYVIHPIRVVNIMIYDLKITDADMIISGLLHDVVEDTKTSIKKIGRQFGKKIARLILTLTRDKTKETKEEKFVKTLRSPKSVRIVKTCDWLDNLRSCSLLTDRNEWWQRYIGQAKEMSVPLAKSTGNKWLIKETGKTLKALLR